MPVPQHIFDPPFNILRASHVVLDVIDLDANRAFYENTIGLHVEDADSEAVYLRGSEEHQHHSLVLRKAKDNTCRRIGFKVATEVDLDKAAAFLKDNGIPSSFSQPPFQGPHAAVHRSVRISDRALRCDGQAPSPAAPLRPL